MAPISSEEQVKFLVSCIKFSQGGKVDFAEVAKDCGIISVGAAAKRYSRLLKSIETGSTGDATTENQDDEPPSSPKKERKKSTPVKRKAAATPKSAEKKAKVTKGDAVAAAERLVEPSLETIKAETDTDMYLFGVHTERDDNADMAT